MAVLNAQYKHPTSRYSQALRDLIDMMLKVNPKQRPDITQVIAWQLVDERTLTTAVGHQCGRQPASFPSIEILWCTCYPLCCSRWNHCSESQGAASLRERLSFLTAEDRTALLIASDGRREEVFCSTLTFFEGRLGEPCVG